jgi:hypothetical protein
MTPAKQRALGRRTEVGTWWNPATPDDVRTEQKRADTARAALSTALVATPPTSSDIAALGAAVIAWNALDAEVKAYALEDPSTFWWTRDTQVSRGQAYETQIESYRQTFARLGAAVPPAPAPAPKPGGLLDTPLFGDTAELFKWGAIAFIAYSLLGRR